MGQAHGTGRRRVLVAQTEADTLAALQDELGAEDYDVVVVADGAEALAAAEEGEYGVIILDVVLPTLGGFEICRELRRAGDTTPILLLSARDQETDKVLGLELGADDYVTKPFSPRELLARVRALARRAVPRGATPERYSFGDVHVDFSKRRVVAGGEPVPLTATEFDILRSLIEHRDRVVERGVLLEEVWGKDWDIYPRTIDSHVAHLRKKLERDPSRPEHILNVRGLGYRFEP